MDQRLTPHKTIESIQQPVQRYRRWLLVISAGAALAAWSLAVRLGNLPAFILPSPERVAARGWQALRDGSLLYHAGVTLLEVLLGLLAGSIVATVLGYLLARSRLVEQLVSPYLVASQAIPVVAVAPLLVIWFGPGMFSKVLVCALIVFFPILINTLVGLQAVPKNLRNLMRAMQATPWQTLRHLELPAALPVILGGLRVGATLSVTGAVVGEFIGADRGLGFLISVGRGQYDTALVFVTIFALVVMALSLYGLVILAEKRLLRWRQNGHHEGV
jgi:NitT/TauT family transport system permease protein